MNYPLYDPAKIPMKPKFWLAKPNKQIITRLKELDDKAKFKEDLSVVYELSGSIPYYIDENHKSVKNPHVESFINKYLIKMEFMNKTEWFVIEDVDKEAKNEESLIFTAYSLEYNLRGVKLYEYEMEDVTPAEAMKDLLSETIWKVGKIDSQIAEKHRSFTFSMDTNILDAMNTIAESYNGILVYNTATETIDLLHEDTVCIHSMLLLNEHNYINSINDKRDSNEIVTRLYPIGDEKLTINAVSPTASSYIENFDYFMRPFKRDKDKNVISSSRYMSDELCHSILDHQEAIASIEDEVKMRLSDITSLNVQLDALSAELSEAQLGVKKVNEILDMMRNSQEYHYYNFKYSGDSYSTSLREGYWVIQARSKTSSSASLSFNGNTLNLNDSWSTYKYDFSSIENEATNMNITMSSGTNAEFYIARIPKVEYDEFTDTKFRDKYNVMYREDNYALIQANYDRLNSNINDKELQLLELKNTIDESIFFTKETLKEKYRFVFVKFWEESTHTNAQELYNDAVEQLKELNAPKIEINVDIFNFLNSLEDKRNWKKLSLGKKVRIKHSKIDVESDAILMTIEYDFEGESINLTFKDVRDVIKDKFAQLIYDASSSSNTLALNKFIYDDASSTVNALKILMNETWDANVRRIHAGVNESVQISNRGLQIINPDFPNEMLIGQAGTLSLSKDGGQTFTTAITADHIIAEVIMGKVLLGERVWIQDDNGIVTIKGNLIEIKDEEGNTQVSMGEFEEGNYGLEVNNGNIKINGGLTEDNISEAFKDRVISNAEAKMIQGYLNTLEQQKIEQDGIYNSIINDTYLGASAKTNLSTAKSEYNTAYTNLTSYITTITADNKITETENLNYITRNDIFKTKLQALITAVQEAEKSIETNNVNYFDNKVRTDLRLTAPLPNNITLNSSGITATTTLDSSKYAKMDNRGFVAVGGAFQVYTDASSTSKGMAITGDGIKAFDSYGYTKFSVSSSTGRLTATDVDITGNINATSGYFSGELRGANGTFSGNLSGNTISSPTINGGTINGSSFIAQGTSGGYYVTTTLDASGLAHAHSSYGGIKLQYGVVDGNRPGFMIVPTSGSSRGMLYLSNSDLYVVNSSGNTSFRVQSSNGYTEVSGSMDVQGSLNVSGSPVATERSLSNSGYLTYNSARNSFWEKGTSTGFLSDWVWIGNASIGVGGQFDSSGSTYTSIGQSNIYLPGSLHAGGKVYSGGTALTSSRDKKKNITPYEKNALEEINNTQVYQYHLKEELDTEHKHLGLILQESPVDIVDPEGAIELYAMATLTFKGLQEEDLKVERVTNEVSLLKLENKQLKDEIKLIKEHLKM